MHEYLWRVSKWGIASAWLPIFYHTHISVFLFFARFPRLISRSQRSGGTFSLSQNATQQHDCLVLCWYHYRCTPHLQRWNSLVHSVVGCQQVKLSECQPLCTCCKLHLDENRGLKPWHSLLLFASPRCSSLNSNTHACCLPRFSRYSPGQSPVQLEWGTIPIAFLCKTTTEIRLPRKDSKKEQVYKLASSVLSLAAQSLAL